MTASQSEWQTAELTRTYLEGVRGAIPAAALQLEVLAQVVHAWQPTPRRLLDLGCGDGILGRTLRLNYPEVETVYLDFSQPMLNAARRKVGDDPHANIILADYGQPAWLEAVAPYGFFDVIVSGFSIHHQPDSRKRSLYAELYDLLAEGGVFLNLEHVSPATRAVEVMFDDYFVDHLVRFHQVGDPGASREALAESYYARPDKKENLLAPLDEQLAWLRQLGFQDVDCFFKIFELALFGGRKPASPQARA